jgi:hypothetical protein
MHNYGIKSLMKAVFLSVELITALFKKSLLTSYVLKWFEGLQARGDKPTTY